MKSQANSTSSSCIKDLVDISGICNPSDVTAVIKNFPYWMQMYVPEQLTIPAQKPDAEVLNSINVSVDILRSEVIKTPQSYDSTGTGIAPNLEGKILTGRKLIIEGQLCQKIEYTADFDEQPVHSAHFYVPFSAYIVVPREITFPNSTEPVDSLDVNFDVNACVEDVSACLLDNRTILKKTTLLLYAVPAQSC